MATATEQATHPALRAVDFDEVRIQGLIKRRTLLIVNIMAGIALEVALLVEQESLDGHIIARRKSGRIGIRRQY